MSVVNSTILILLELLFTLKVQRDVLYPQLYTLYNYTIIAYPEPIIKSV